jgi:hypothetical protein
MADALVISDEGRPLTVVCRRPNNGVYINQAGKAYVLLSAAELERLIAFTHRECADLAAASD